MTRDLTGTDVLFVAGFLLRHALKSAGHFMKMLSVYRYSR